MRKSAATDHLKDNGITSSKDLHPECFGKARVRNIKIIDMATSGASLAEIAREVGISGQSVTSIIFARVNKTRRLKKRDEWEAMVQEKKEDDRKARVALEILHFERPLIKKLSNGLSRQMHQHGFSYSLDQTDDDILQTCKNFHGYMLAVFDCPIFGIKYGNQPRWSCPEGIGAGWMYVLAGITGIEFVAPPPTPRHHPTHRKAFGYTVTIETYERLKKEARYERVETRLAEP